MRQSKYEYEQYLNNLGVPMHDNADFGGRCSSNRYGTWLRKYDPFAFNTGLKEWSGEKKNDLTKAN